MNSFAFLIGILPNLEYQTNQIYQIYNTDKTNETDKNWAEKAMDRKWSDNNKYCISLDKYVVSWETKLISSGGDFWKCQNFM